MKKATDLLYDILTKKGWTVKKQRGEIGDLPESVKNRYHNIPIGYMDFLCNIGTCVNPDETTWLLGIEDFKRQGGDAFRWNEFEIISLQSAADANDEKWRCEIKNFWDNHLPICMSVNGGYEYYAVRMKDGFIVHGFEPEFEEATEVAGSFEKFVEMVCAGEIDL